MPENEHGLPEIPIIEAPEGPAQLARMRSAQLPHMVRVVQQTIPPPLLRWADRYAARCLRCANNPYCHEVDMIAGLLGQPGAYALNFSFEMGCTTACHSPDGRFAMQLYRTLDWPFRLGRDVVVARHAPAAGAYYNISWPGYVGVLTAMAPGRFAAAINQPPMAYSLGHRSLGVAIDWMVNRWRIRKATALPPAHLLRQAFEQCTSFAAAKVMLTTTPICIPVIYTLTGTTPDEGCIIERSERDAVVHEGPGAVANHWLHRGFTGRPRGRNSRLRLAAMQAALPQLDGAALGWLTPPVLNRLTRIAAELNAGTSHLAVQGWYGSVKLTQVLTLAGPTAR
ncbi:MAG TPA: hypothetical protein VGI78_21945 [Acetobacteraceae bacterium]